MFMVIYKVTGSFLVNRNITVLRRKRVRVARAAYDTAGFTTDYWLKKNHNRVPTFGAITHTYIAYLISRLHGAAHG